MSAGLCSVYKKETKLVMLSDTFTLNVGATPADRIFTRSGKSNSEVIFHSPSDDGDLGGRIKFRVSHETTKSGIERSLQQFVWPQLNATTGLYDSFLSGSYVLSRSQLASLVTVDELLEMSQEVWALTDFREDFANSET